MCTTTTKTTNTNTNNKCDYSSSSSSSSSSSTNNGVDGDVVDDQDHNKNSTSSGDLVLSKTNKKKKNKKDSSSSSSFRLLVLVFLFLRFIILELPVLLCFILLLSTLFIKELWYNPIHSLIDSFKLKAPNNNDDNDMENNLGLYVAHDKDITYYNRKCDIRDISTKDSNDILILKSHTSNERRTVMLKHGAIVMKDILSKDTSTQLRNYLEGRHKEFHLNNLKLPYNELFWNGDENGSRLALGLGPEDNIEISNAINEIGMNIELKKTLESIVGNDPSVLEVSTLSTMHNAEPQGIHTDSDYFSSSVLYARSFLHSYTMFIALQDTTSKMGATTICPGTHWCADDDLANLCKCNIGENNGNDDDGNDGNDNDDDDGVCNTFEASSNGLTGINDGVLLKGDAMMFNQNLWHRGPRNYDLNHIDENRVMFIVTFVSRRATIEHGDNRQQGWGTYYYMRHNMWGHTFSDLKTAGSSMMMNNILRTSSRIFKAYGLYAKRIGNLSWLEHFARQIANDMDDYDDGDTLDDFKNYLKSDEMSANNKLMKWLLALDTEKKTTNVDIEVEVEVEVEVDAEVDADADADADADVDNWIEYLSLLVESAVYQSQKLYVATIMLLTAIIFLVSLKQKQKQSSSSSSPSLSSSRNWCWFLLRRIVSGHVVIFVIALFIRQYVLYETPLFKRIYNQDINFQPFQELPFDQLTESHFDPNTSKVTSTTTNIGEQYHPVHVLYKKQTQQQNIHRKQYPKHPYHNYYEKEIEKLKQLQKPRLPQLSLQYKGKQQQVVPEQPKQATAYPDRYDILIGTRYDANFLSSMNDMLNFHPGNKIWIDLIKEYTATANLNLNLNLNLNSSNHLRNDNDFAMIDIIAENIVHTMIFGQSLVEQSLVISSGNIHPYHDDGSSVLLRRFLKQDYETGYWIILTFKEALEVTRHELHSKLDPMYEFIWTYWKHVLAKSRFGSRRDTIMSKIYTPLIVDSWLTNELFKNNNKEEESCDSSANPYLPAVTPMTTMSIMGGTTSALSSSSSSSMSSAYLLPSTARNILPNSLVSGVSAADANNSFIKNKNISDNNTFISIRITPFRQHIKELNSNIITLKIGDIITVKGTDANDNDNDNGNQLPYQAMIIDIEDEEYLDIQPIRTDNINNDKESEDDDDDDDENEEDNDSSSSSGDDDGGGIRSVNINEIQLYRPINEYDKVWVLTDDDEWKIYEVLFLTPWGTADVLLTDEYLDLDTNENDENEAIVMDTREFFLIDDEVPFIRLKQY